MLEILTIFISFFVIALASREIGNLLSRLSLPRITGYLFTGMLVGPFLLNLIPKGSTEDLVIIDQVSLAVIAFIAGSELFVKELRSRLRPIIMNTMGVVIAGIIINSFAFFLLTEFIPFTQGMDVLSRLAIAVLGSTILLTLSPPSTIAVIQEVRARGFFSKTILSMTVVMDVFVIVLFAIVVAFASAVLEPSNELDLTFLAKLAIDLLIALGVGIIVGYIISLLLGLNLHKWIKLSLILLLGTGVFVGSAELAIITKAMGFEIVVEALLICMIAGFYVTNFSDHHRQFEHLLHDISPLVYVAFFTLTGIGLKLDILLSTIGIAIILFSVRIISIMIGSFAGGYLAHEDKMIQRNAWMGLITQAGIALGLARGVTVEFPTLGDSFGTLIVSVIVLNEIFGPLFLKHVLRRVGESHEPAAPESDIDRDVVIFGMEGQAARLASLLQLDGWKVKLSNHSAYTDQDETLAYVLFNKTDPESIKQIMNTRTDAIVAMLDNDDTNFEVCQMAYEEFGIRRIVVRLNDISTAHRFEQFGAIIIDTASALVNLMNQAVRAPQSTALMMHQDPEYDIVQITITDSDWDGVFLRDLRLPSDVLILEIDRKGSKIVPNGNSVLRHQDEVTLIGRATSLSEVTLMLGY